MQNDMERRSRGTAMEDRLADAAKKLGLRSLALYVATSGVLHHGSDGFAHGDYLIRTALFPEKDEAAARIMPWHLDASKDDLGAACARVILGMDGSGVRTGGGRRWLLVPLHLGEDGTVVAVAPYPENQAFPTADLEKIGRVAKDGIDAFHLDTYRRHADFAIKLSERLSAINSTYRPDGEEEFEREIQDEVAYIAEAFGCREMTLCLADDEAIAAHEPLRQHDPDRLYSVRWTTLDPATLVDRDFRALKADGPQGWVLEKKATHLQPGFPLLYGDPEASMRQVPPIDMADRRVPRYLRHRSGVVDDVVICPLIVDDALMGFIRAGFRQHAPYVIGLRAAQSIQAAGQGLVRLVQTHAASRRSHRRTRAIEDAVKALGRLNEPGGDDRHAPDLEELATAALEELLGIWEPGAVVATSIDARFEDDNTTIRVDVPADADAEGRNVATFELRSRVYSQIGGLLTIRTSTDNPPPSRLDVIGELFADRLALKLSVRRFAMLRAHEMDDLEKIAQREAKLHEVLHEANHQLTTPLQVALTKTGEVIESIKKGHWRDATATAQAARDWMRRTHRISRATELFQVLHEDKPLPKADAVPLSRALVERTVRTAVDQMYHFSEMNPFAPSFIFDPSASAPKERWAQTTMAPDVLDQIVFNLLENAYKYGLPNTKVMVEVGTSRTSRPLIRVNSYGEAITDASRLVERGFRDPGVFLRVGEGQGLGLWIVDQVMRRLGGELLIESSAAKDEPHRFSLIFRKD